MKGIKLITMFAIILAGLMYACSEDNNSVGSGTLKIHLTDAPFPTDLVEEANVTINKIEIRRSDDIEGNRFVILSEEEMTFNLLDLTNGITAALVDMEIESGAYDLIRLYVSDAGIKLKNGEEYDLKVPSGSQTGIKVFIDPALIVSDGLTSELLLDFDVSKSFVLKGNINSPAGIKGFNFKPVIKASNLSTSGRIIGVVNDVDEQKLEGVQVALIAADTVYTTSFTDEEGAYAIIGVDAGTYGLRFEKEGYEVLDIADIMVVAANSTVVNGQLTSIVTTQ